MNRNPQGLWKPAPEVIARARDDTSAQINRILLTFVGTTIFCLLSLLTPDSALLAGGEKLNVPFAGPVSFFGFMLLGPAVLIVLRIYLQIYVEHERRLDLVAQSMPSVRALTLTPARNPLLRVFGGFVFFLLLPLAMLSFSWKAAVFPYWGTGLFSVTAAVVAMHLMLLVRGLSWPIRSILSLGVAIVAGGMMMGLGPVHRPFGLPRANLSDLWIDDIDLRGADLRHANLTNTSLWDANLSGADLIGARLAGALLERADLTDAELETDDLSGADLAEAKLVNANFTGGKLINAFLGGADLTGATLTRVNLSGANLSAANLTDTSFRRANLSGANLIGANLTGADLNRANLSGANLGRSKGLTQEQFDKACGDAKTLLPPGIKLVTICSQD